MQNLKQLLFQFIKFGFVGGSCFLADAGCLTLLKELFNVNVYIASALAFSFSVILNYLLSMRFVFAGRDGNKTREFIVFVILSIGGLGLNQLIMWIGVDILVLHYLFMKVVSTAIVLVYNFITRKIFIEKHNP